ncbi:hypothetical protein SAMN04487983_104227 [Streptomyces sp. yr375]|uniref:hypothetical protein n=1 Tax=Streptomyces sp. yr375 TaxID=1761906 RepID=UPI0008B91650|nr:hypothetical protein [Streptomyces sp. yr375]SES31414.1 hypothetical protein SAMN04487983_104227 [Streptomyces sp. yr375]
MPRTLTAIPADRLMTVVTGILGTEWTPPAAPEWPLVLTNETADRELTLYPERKNARLVFVLAPADTDDFGRRRYAKYTPDLTGHDTIDAWLAEGDLDAIADALALILERLVEQPLPERTAHHDPLGAERENLAKQAQELAAHATYFAAGLIWSQPVGDDAQRLATLAQGLAHTATRVDELRGHKNPRR